MMVTNEQLEDILRNENYSIECNEVNDTNIHAIARGLLEALVLIKEVRDEICELGLTYKGVGVEAVCNNILEQTKEYAQ